MGSQQLALNQAGEKLAEVAPGKRIDLLEGPGVKITDKSNLVKEETFSFSVSIHQAATKFMCQSE